MKLRTFIYALVATVVALLLIGVVGFYWLTAQSPLGLLRGGQASPAAAMFVSKQAPAMVSLLVNPDRLAAFRVAIAQPGERRRARAEIEQLKETLLTSRGIRYEQDVQPWLGDEVTLAVTTPDLDRDAENGNQPGYLLAIATRNPQRSREFLQLFWQKQAVAGVDLVFEQYSGVKIIYGNPATPAANLANLASAVVGDRFVLFANDPKVLRDAITNVQAPDLSLSRSKTYQKGLEQLPDRQIGTLFVSLPHLGDWLSGSQFHLINADDEDLPHLYESLVVALELDPQGVVAETALLTALGQKLTPVKPALSEPVEALQFIPATSSLSASGVDLRQFWQDVTTGLADYSVLSALIQRSLTPLAQSIKAEPPDLFNWVTQEFALGLLPSPVKNQAEWVFVAERSPDTDSAIERFNAIAQQQGLSTGPLTLNDRPIYAWTKLSTLANGRKQRPPAVQAEVQAVHTTVGKYEVFATSVAALDQALNAAKSSLLTNAQFQQAIATIAARNDGYLYVDWQAVRKLASERLPLLKLTEVVAKPVLDHVRSLTMSSYGNETNVRRGTVFIQLQNP
ncbi:DUF3352 domain-containing protein [Oscillatoria sp. FACHB-1407]|uniref:DUF3352 domain-containing protein n=1 Tax=Oscillatoria sp. FACHB-1407 TaxID=2692847 RepID=UPI001682CA85|nr:DUF3352 domain-containing protein [Oscillatoria sp. FACHB-1407]MBD2460632.1 DUF3352 domain-containing protein [Oscillatoria sp. FACHB-1407]